jgi:glycosyltransferase involved in cell wall biosynthesis
MDVGVPVAALALNPHLPFPRALAPDLAAAPQLTWNTANALRRAVEEGPTLYHLLAPFEPGDLTSPWLPIQVSRNDVPLVISVYDLIPEVMGFVAAGSRAERFYRIRNRLLAGADLLLAISEQTRHDVIDRLGVTADRVHVVGAGCSEYFRPPDSSECPEAILREHVPAIDRPYVLTVSAWEPRKNTELLIDAFAMLPREARESLQLVIACNLPPDGLRIWRERATQQGLPTSSVVFTGFVPDRVLRALYQHAGLFVDPSRYEGFGLPALEAARCAAPCVVAHAPGLQEVIEWEPARFNVDDAEGLAAIIHRGVHDPEFRSKLLDVATETAERHTWERVAQRTVTAYSHLERPSRRRRKESPLRIALVGPFPPVRTGIADYDAGAAAHLAEHCDLDCFVDAGDWSHADIRHEVSSARVGAAGPRRPIDTRARWFPAQAMGLRVDPVRYDAVIYALGNSWFHHDTLALARRYPGIAWFHDVDLTGLYITYMHRLLARPNGVADARALCAEVRSRYGARMPDLAASVDLSWATYEPYRRAGTRFTVELARDAQTCLVPSERARTALEIDAGPPEILPPLHVVPLAVPEPAASRPVPTTPPSVVALGRQDADAKRPETLLEAMAVVVRARPARLALVGEIRPELRTELRRRAADLGIDDAVEITGYVDDVEYRRRLAEASCALQLRRCSDDGTGSAAVNDALACGLPVITNLASCGELPRGTVQAVSDEATSGEVAGEILRVLDDEGHRHSLSDGALAYARSWSFADVTMRLLAIIDATRGARWRQQPKSA